MCSIPTDTRMRSGADAGRQLLLIGQLLVGGAGGVDDQRFGVADIGQM